MKFALLVFFSVNYNGVGLPDGGKSGPAAVTIPGYANLAACNAAKKSLKDQLNNPDVNKRTFVFCIPSP